MPSLPSIKGADSNRLNQGPRHPKQAKFSNGAAPRGTRRRDARRVRRRRVKANDNGGRRRRGRTASRTTITSSGSGGLFLLTSIVMWTADVVVQDVMTISMTVGLVGHMILLK